MTDRTALKNLRPEIPTILEDNHSSAAEEFQNQCLRPILKLQHELLIALFQQYIVKRKNKYHKLTPANQPTYIEQSIRQDLKFKNLLIGTIIGHFTLEEYQRYVGLEKELRRRITDLLIQRIQDEFAP